MPKISKNKLILPAVAAATVALGMGGFDAHAAEANVTTPDELKTCLTTTGNVCTLGANISDTASTFIEIPASVDVTLDLNGYALGDNDGDNGTIDITNNGKLLVKDSVGNGASYAILFSQESGVLEIANGIFNEYILAKGTSTVSISSGTFNDYVSSNDNAILNIANGTFNGSVSANSNTTLNIENGTFSSSVRAAGSSILNVQNGVFNGYVGSGEYDGTGALTISDGTFNSSVSIYGSGQISGGVFNDTLFGGSSNSRVVITGGEFKDMNFILYNEGSSLEISGGVFTVGFAIGVQTLKITGGEFRNDDMGWMAFIYEHPDTQSYSITGGNFVNTSSEYGNLMTIKTSMTPTEDYIRALFAGGSVLDGTNLEINGVWTEVKKARVDAGESSSSAGVAVPNTGASVSEDGSGLNETSVAITIVTILASCFAAGALVYNLKHKKVSFRK